MFKILILCLIYASSVYAEGYYCPYESLGFDGRNDLLYDYYESSGDHWVRMGRTGWETRQSYCRAKGDASLHDDAGEAKCVDSQGTCRWSGSSCEVNQTKTPDCFELCKAVVDGRGLSCLGNCPDGYSSRDRLYSICSSRTTSKTTSRTNDVLPKETTFRRKPNKNQKKMTCVCHEDL